MWPSWRYGSATARRHNPHRMLTRCIEGVRYVPCRRGSWFVASVQSAHNDHRVQQRTTKMPVTACTSCARSRQNAHQVTGRVVLHSAITPVSPTPTEELITVETSHRGHAIVEQGIGTSVYTMTNVLEPDEALPLRFWPYQQPVCSPSRRGLGRCSLVVVNTFGRVGLVQSAAFTVAVW